MARYIDADALLSRLPDDLPYKASVKRVLMQAHSADVAPKSEVEFWQDAAANAKREVAREIFEEIENWFELYSEREYSFAEEEASKGHLTESEAHDYALDIIKDLRQLCIAEEGKE